MYTSHEVDYLNYGAIGSVVGHELTHAFDNDGRFYDADGNQNNWWTDNDEEDFEQFSQCFVNQYNNITYYINNEPYKVNGERTLDEVIADNGGIARAYDAWQMTLSKHPEQASEHNKRLPGFSDFTFDQLFFINFAQSHCSIIANEAKTDGHPRGNARVNGLVSNSLQFAKAFHCSPNSPMNPEQKCLIW